MSMTLVRSSFTRTGCSEDETGADAEVGGCADIVGNGGKGGDAVEGGGGSVIQGEHCPQCGLFCWNSRILQLHLEEAHKTTLNAIDKNDLQAQFTQVSCKVCNKTFANVYRLQRHMISHDESAVLRKFKCPHCEKAFKFKHHLKEHLRIHSGEKPFQCNNCGKRFSHSGSYSSHMTSKKCLIVNLKKSRQHQSQNQQSNNSTATGVVGNSKKHQANRRDVELHAANNNTFLLNMPKLSPTHYREIQRDGADNMFDAPTMVPPMIFGNYFLQSSLGNIFSHLQQNRRGDDGAGSEQSCYENHSEALSPSTADSDGTTEGTNEGKDSPALRADGVPQDLDAVRRLLETVNTSVTIQLLEANVRKLASSPATVIKRDPDEDYQDHDSVMSSEMAHYPPDWSSSSVAANHESQSQSDSQHSENPGPAPPPVVKQEKNNHQLRPSYNHGLKRDRATAYGSEAETEDEERHLTNGKVGAKNNSQVGGDGRRPVRARSLIDDDQLAVLKSYYAINPKPKKEEIVMIANYINFPTRVVQVWFQNSRARDRRESRIPALLPLSSLNNSHHHQVVPNNEQPLDLSKKDVHQNHRNSTPLRFSPKENYVDHVGARRSGSVASPVRMMEVAQRISASQDHPVSLDRVKRERMDVVEDRKPILAPYAPPPATKSLPAWQQQPSVAAAEDAEEAPLVIDEENPDPTEAARHPVAVAVAGTMENSRETPVQIKIESDSSARSDPVPQTEAEQEGAYFCDQCDKTFSKHSSLARHKYEHSGQRPYKCVECPKAFKHKHHLTEHKRLHSGEKPFQCSKCLKRFSHSGSYSQHMNHRYSYCKPYRE